MSREPAFPGSEDGMMNIHESLSGKRFSLAASVLACYKMGQLACGRCLGDVFYRLCQCLLSVCIHTLSAQRIANRVASLLLSS